MTGCASVRWLPKSSRPRPKNSNCLPKAKSGVYLYRNSVLGKALSKDSAGHDGNCVGASAPDVFFYTQVDGGNRRAPGRPESELSPNKSSRLFFESGKNYVILPVKAHQSRFDGGAGADLEAGD